MWFGIYDNMVYHHGAGYRSSICRLDEMYFTLRFIRKLQSNKGLSFAGDFFEKLWKKQRNSLSDRIYNKLLTDYNFYTIFE